MKQSVKIFLLLIAIFGSVFLSSCVHEDGPLTGKTVCLDPGHGGTSDIDSYRVGVAGEREEWIDLRVALKLKSLLEEKDCRVIMTREKDVAVPLKERALMAIDGEADAFISIHHNATADTTVNFPTVYFHGNASENQASVLLGLTIIRQLRRSLFHADTPVSLVSDHTIFPTAGTAVLRHSYGLPGVIGEASFFSNPSEEQRLKQNDYNDLEAMAYLRGLEEYFSAAPLPVLEKNSLVTIAPFEVFQEAQRMDSVAVLWEQDHQQALILFQTSQTNALQSALDLFTRSARSFPDSWLTGKSHHYRALIFEQLGRHDEALETHNRVKQFYVQIK